MRWIYTEQEMEKGMKELEKSPSSSESTAEEGEAVSTEASGKINIQRYKGLGEMNPQQLWDTTMNPESRLMKQVTVEDAEKANEIFDILMGTEVPARKKFIQTHAKDVQNLDI